MFLKSLEVRGFKSFADKVELKFKKGITAVVGPNGSGKSNISDSVRWVLGEQSVKTLRGGKMEDVIFAGTQFRKALGLAHVSLTLDNSDGALATEYNEVTVTRRIFRSGETEYLINNQKCRLKDITNLFMDTGIGKEGYSLIGQGKIEAILSGKPEERRSLVEEAAGIVKYKSRKVEAEKKLDNTENNLVRIRDIIATYEERIEPLRIEREKALKYKELAEELKIKEVSLIVKNINNIEEELKKLQLELHVMRESIDKKKIKLDSEKESLLQIEKSIEELERKNNSDKEEYYSKKEITTNSKNDIILYQERIKNLTENIEKNIIELEGLEEKIELTKKEKFNLQNELEEKTREQNTRKIELQEIEKEIRDNSVKIDEMDREYSELTEEEFEILRVTSEINNAISGFKKDIANKEEHKKNLETQILSLENNLGINSGTITGLTNNLKLKREEVTKLNNEINEIRKNISVLQQNLSKKDFSIKDLNKNLNRLEANFNMLSDLEKHYEGYARSVKTLMERIEKNQITFAKGTKVLGEIFTVEKIYEVAIEIALGASISNVITENEGIAKNLINYLKSNNLGRATFLPLSIIKGRKLDVANDIRNISGFIGIASDIISHDIKYKSIMDYSLGRTIIAKDMDAALLISKRGNHSYRIVTLTGEVINPGGALTGGSIQGKHTNILGRKRELEDIQKNIENKKATLKEEQSSYENIKVEMKNLDEEILNKRDKIHHNNIDCTKFESEIASLENENYKLKNNLNISKGELVLGAQQLERLNNEILIKNNELSGLENKNYSNKERVDFLKDEIGNWRVNIEVLKEKATELRVNKATLEESVQGKINELSRKEKEVKEFISRLKNVQEENNKNSQNVKDIENDIKEKEDLIDTLKDEIEELELKFKEDDVKKIEYKNQEKSLQTVINEFVEEIRKDEGDLNRKEIANAKDESERDTLYKKLNEELNLTLAEAMEIAIEILNASTVKEEISILKGKITRLGTVNLAAIAEYEEVCEKYEFMAGQEQDLQKAKDELLSVIKEMTGKMQELFKENFAILNKNFNETFKELFKGGTAELILTEGDELTANIDINVQPPGKKLQNINLMSGGEKVLSAIALMFAILKMKPTPFCILDEIEAALDDANVYRYAEFLKEFKGNSQFIVITHRKGTMEAADMMYGVTMEEKGVSKVVSVDLTENY